jgi:hypothetical protein
MLLCFTLSRRMMLWKPRRVMARRSQWQGWLLRKRRRASQELSTPSNGSLDGCQEPKSSRLDSSMTSFQSIGVMMTRRKTMMMKRRMNE